MKKKDEIPSQFDPQYLQKRIEGKYRLKYLPKPIHEIGHMAKIRDGVHPGFRNQPRNVAESVKRQRQRN